MGESPDLLIRIWLRGRTARVAEHFFLRCCNTTDDILSRQPNLGGSARIGTFGDNPSIYYWSANASAATFCSDVTPPGHSPDCGLREPRAPNRQAKSHYEHHCLAITVVVTVILTSTVILTHTLTLTLIPLLSLRLWLTRHHGSASSWLLAFVADYRAIATDWRQLTSVSI